MTTPTTNYAIGKPINGADATTWGTELNTALDLIDTTMFTFALKASPTFTGAASFVSGTFSTTLGVTGVLTATGGLAGNVTGNLTGNIVGNTSISGNVAMAAGKVIAWNADSGISRSGAASLLVGNGTDGDQTGTVAAAKFTTSSNANITSPGSGIMQVGTGTTTGAGGTLNAAGFNGTIGATTPATGAFTTLATSGAATLSASAATPPVAVTFNATTMTLNAALSNVFTTTFTANVTVAPTLSNPADGQTINWFITQDGTGSRTMTWPTSFKWVNGSAGVLTTTASAVDLLVATYRSSTGFWYASLSKGFA